MPYADRDKKRAWDRQWIGRKRAALRAARRRDSEAYLRAQAENPTDVPEFMTAEQWQGQCKWMLSLTPIEDLL